MIIEKILEQYEVIVMFQANPNCQNVLVYSAVYFISNSSDARAFSSLHILVFHFPIRAILV